METIRGKAFHDVFVVLDEKHFIECTFTACVLEYKGLPVIVESSSFTGCSFRFKGEAARTVRFLECFSLSPDEPQVRRGRCASFQDVGPVLTVM